ncbi:MAG: transglycosylase domain-containing protein, partial [Bacteroidota bacterium]|nr:transglycosylase domain-containing protein [Bacteroidota bacterium]
RKTLRYISYVILFFFFYYIALELNIFWLFGRMPSVTQLKNPRMPQVSEVYTADSVLIGRYYTENRVPVKFEQISPYLIKALIATEDARFYKHSGVDLRAIGGVFLSMTKGDQRGGSTITQQLAKNLFKTRKGSTSGLLGYIPGIRTIVAKNKEWVTALKLEHFFTKNEILTLYFNTVDYGHNTYGIRTACRTYFNTTPDSVTIDQAATLVGVLKATSLYSPLQNPQNCLQRRNTVLSQMLKYKIITKNQYAEYSQKPLGLKYTVEKVDRGFGLYFKNYVNQYIEKWCNENGYDLYYDGLKIYTTIDSKMQKLAEEAMTEHMKALQRRFNEYYKNKRQNPWIDENKQEIPNFIENLMPRTEYYKHIAQQFNNNKALINKYLNTRKKMRVFTYSGVRDTTLTPMDSLRYYMHFLHAGFMVSDPFNGYIKCWVGDVNYQYFQYDHVYQSRRQPGSAFKPFVYTAAIDNGYSPCDKIVDKPLIVKFKENGVEKEWAPRNVDRKFSHEEYTLRRAMARSVNSIAAQLTMLVGPEKVRDYARRMGINTPLNAYPSIGLGTNDVTLYDMIGAYGTFLNKGVWTEPIPVIRITDRNGKVLHEFKPRQRRVFSEETAFLMLHMLKGGLEEPGGTSQALFQYDMWRGNEMGGKTGTSNNYSDGWFMGVTPNYVGGAWVGGEQRCIRFQSSSYGEGSKMALPIYGLFFYKAYQKHLIKMGYFPKPTINITKPYQCTTKYTHKADTSAGAEGGLEEGMEAPPDTSTGIY